MRTRSDIRLLDTDRERFRPTRTGEDRTELALVRAHSYLGVFHPDRPCPKASLVRGLEILRPPGEIRGFAVPLWVRGPSASIAAWVREDLPSRQPDNPYILHVRKGALVWAGHIYPAESEPATAWAERGLRGDWRGLVGADGAYLGARIDARPDRLALLHDRYGTRRHHTCVKSGTLWFGSSLNALAAVPELELTVSPDAVAALGMNRQLPEPVSLFVGISRPHANTGELFTSAQQPPLVHTGPRWFPMEKSGWPPPRLDSLVEELNVALLTRLERLTVESGPDEIGIWMTAGLDSRWLAAGLQKLGHPFSLWSIGMRENLDVEVSERVGVELGADVRLGLVQELSDVVDELPETNWQLEGRSSLMHQFTGGLFNQLQERRPVMLQGYLPNMMKWIPAGEINRVADRMGKGKSLGDAARDYASWCGHEATKFGVELLRPGITDRVEDAVREVLAKSAPQQSYHFFLALMLDAGPVERNFSLARLGSTTGGCDAPLLDAALLAVALRATTLPELERRVLQPRCIEALCPELGRYPTTPFKLPLGAMTGSRGRVVAHALRHPGWLTDYYRAKKTKTIHASPIRMKLLARPVLLRWACDFLTQGGLVADAFGDGLDRFCDAVATTPKNKTVGVLYNLVSLELYGRAWQRAAAGKLPYAEPLELPG